ncbi:MAG: hypothetical protein MPI95_07880 [Nitrosopumilus sp.]|nr:hypothetical protein [Nitrosopumilus sp.]
MPSMGSGDAEACRRHMYMLLYAPVDGSKFNVPVPGTEHLHKQLFVLSKELPGGAIGFENCPTGPYSPRLSCVKDCCIEVDSTIRMLDGGRLQLTDKGLNAARVVWDSEPDLIREHVIGIKEFMNDMEYREMMFYIYSTFPETMEGSSLLGDYERNRVDVACSLFVKEKATLSLAASVAGMRSDDLADILHDRGVATHVAEDIEGFVPPGAS